MVAALSLQPDHLIFFYDNEMFDTFEIYSTYLACKKYLPALKFELRSVDYHDYPMIESKIGQFIQDNCNDDICIDLTGGSELMTIAGYNAGKNANVQVFFSDIYKSEVVSLTKNGPKYRSLPFTLEDIIEAGGGKVAGSVSSKTAYLINNDSTSSSAKNKKAAALNIPVITEAQFMEMFGIR